MAAEEREDPDLNRDPLTGEIGTHPIGTGVGATGGALTGAAVGAIAGPIGAAVGAIAGAVAGGLAGKTAAEAVNPTAEESHWRQQYEREPYYEQGTSFDDYGPAYRLGVAGRASYSDDDWTKAEPRLAREWETARGKSTLDWERARPASRAAWERVHMNHYRHLDDEGRLVGAASDTSDTTTALRDLVECCKDGEYGFRECAEQADRADLKTTFLQRADDCRAAAVELNELIRQCGGSPESGGSAMGAIHRGWVAVKAALSTYDDKAVLNEAERGEDNAVSRYRKALEKPLAPHIRQVVERQMQGAQRNHDQIRLLRDAIR